MSQLFNTNIETFFDPETIKTLSDPKTVETFFDPEINDLYDQYLGASNNTDYFVQSLGDVITNVYHGERKEYPLLDCVKGCLKAMVFTRSTPLDKQIEMAEEDFSERYETMTPEQQKVCDRYKL